jgi:hypothetical protein
VSTEGQFSRPPDSRRVIVDRDVDVAALLRVIRGLETLP